MKWGCERTFLGWVLVSTNETQLHDSLDMNVQCLQVLPDDVFGHSLAQILHQEPHTAVL
jgi:hypothetical protein